MNYNINFGMEFKFNVGLDCFWVWYILVDYVEGEVRFEKLVIKLKLVEIVGKFREVFEDFKEIFFVGMFFEVE